MTPEKMANFDICTNMALVMRIGTECDEMQNTKTSKTEITTRQDIKS